MFMKIFLITLTSKLCKTSVIAIGLLVVQRNFEKKLEANDVVRGAGDEDRTRNFQLGKLTLYH